MTTKLLSSFLMGMTCYSSAYGQGGDDTSWIFDYGNAGSEHIVLQPVGQFIYAGGFFEGAGTRENFQRFNLATEAWEPVESFGNMNTAAIRSMFHDPEAGLLFVGGNGTIGAANGSIGVLNLETQEWSTLRDTSLTDEQTGTQVGGFIRSIIRYQGDIIIAGSLFGTEVPNSNNIRRFDQTTSRWVSVGDGLEGDVPDGEDDERNGAPGTIWDLKIGPDGRLYAAGGFTQNGDGSRSISGLAVLEGNEWQQVAGGVDGVVRKIEFTDAGIYVGGDFTSVGSGAGLVVADDIALLENGTTWNSLNSENFVTETNFTQDGIFCFAPTENGIYFVGDFNFTVNGEQLTRVGYWNGTSYESLGTGVGRTGVQIAQSCTILGEDLFVAGNFLVEGMGNTRISFARWNPNEDFSDYVSGSNDPRSLFKWSPEITEITGEGVSVRIPGGTRVGSRYQLMYSPDLETEFTRVGFSEPGTFDTERTFPIDDENQGARGFYRVDFED